MENKFTPGPWSVGQYSFDDYQFSVYGSDQVKICTLEGWNPGNMKEGEANANIIASAPDLLAACEEAEEKLLEEGWHPQGIVLKNIREAIAKAKGE
jgi:hypothetical protein